MQGSNIKKEYSVERIAYSRKLNASRIAGYHPLLHSIAEKRYPPNAKTFWRSIISLAFCSLIFVLYCFAEQQFAYDARGKRDPFIPLVTPDGRFIKLEKKETNLGLLLEGIIYDERGLSYAIVNGEIVRVSDEVAGYQVLKIEQNKVVFIKSGQTMEIELKEEEH